MISSSGESVYFNILTGRPIEKVDMEQLFFELSDTGYNLRGHSKRLTDAVWIDSRKYFLATE